MLTENKKFNTVKKPCTMVIFQRPNCTVESIVHLPLGEGRGSQKEPFCDLGDTRGSPKAPVYALGDGRRSL